MDSHVVVEGWPSDDDPQAYDLVCRECDGRSRLNPGDHFVAQVRVFLDQHRHGPAAPP